MKLQRLLILFLCILMPLQASADRLMGCEMIDSAMRAMASEKPSVQMLSASHDSHAPCHDMAMSSDDSSSHSDSTPMSKTHCHYCKGHCSSASVLVIVNGLSIASPERETYLPHPLVQHLPVYLGLPQKPPQFFS